MQFKPFNSRPSWRSQWEKLGYSGQFLDNYWIEDTANPFCAVLEDKEVAELLIPATLEINELLLKLVDHVCNSSQSSQLLEFLQVPKFFHEAVRQSWRRDDKAFYGRLDFAFTGQSLKLLEVNFDTPVMLLESALLQKLWLDEQRSGAPNDSDYVAGITQFNNLDTDLNLAMAGLFRLKEKVHFASFYAPEDQEALFYLQRKADSLGFKASFAHADQYGVNEAGSLVDEGNGLVTQFFKLYPWEVLVEEDLRMYQKTGKYIFASLVELDLVRFFEPAWKIVFSSKAALALLWQLFPGHKWLLETHLDNHSAEALSLKSRAHVRKPCFGRCGENVEIIFPDNTEKNETATGDYGDNLFIIQDYSPLPVYGDYHLVVGSWLIAGRASGVGLRADRSLITGANTLFVPHYVVPEQA